MMVSDLNDSDYKLIVNRLVSFIVLEGKTFVDENEKVEYVKSYLKLFVKIINQPSEVEEEDSTESKSLLVEHIFKDMSKFV